MSRPRTASLEAKIEIAHLKTKIDLQEKELESLMDFKRRIELGQRWLLCAFYVVGGVIGTALAFIQIIKELNIRFG